MGGRWSADDCRNVIDMDSTGLATAVGPGRCKINRNFGENSVPTPVTEIVVIKPTRLEFSVLANSILNVGSEMKILGNVGLVRKSKKKKKKKG
jgi:hypothetical protein